MSCNAFMTRPNKSERAGELLPSCSLCWTVLHIQIQIQWQCCTVSKSFFFFLQKSQCSRRWAPADENGEDNKPQHEARAILLWEKSPHQCSAALACDHRLYKTWTYSSRCHPEVLWRAIVKLGVGLAAPDSAALKAVSQIGKEVERGWSWGGLKPGCWQTSWQIAVKQSSHGLYDRYV